MFDLPFEEIAPIVGRSPAAARQLASRARRRVQGPPAAPDDDPGRQREVVDAFLAASRGGDMSALLAVLDPDVVFRADPVAARMGGTAQIRGAAAVAATFKGRAQAGRPALVDGTVAVAVVLKGQLRIVLDLAFAQGKIITIGAIADPEHLRRLDIAVLP
jgi:RNA polymerase sigma-70 factor (ECF subfamily)